MNVKTLEELFEYSYWANRRLFAVIAGLSPEQFTRTVGGSYGSVRNTLVHILSAEAGWLERCGGPKRGPRLNADHFPTLDSIITAWSIVETNIRRFLSELRDEDLTRKVEFAFEPSQEYSMPIGELLHHCVVHAVHHRGQIALLLRMLGHVPGNFDLFNYCAV